MFDVFKEIRVLALLECGASLLCQHLPVDETGVIRVEAGSHYVAQQFCAAAGDILGHLISTLFFKLALTGSQPDKDLIVETLAIFIHEVCQDDGFSAACAAFQNDLLFRFRHGFHQVADGFQLIICKTHNQPSSSR